MVKKKVGLLTGDISINGDGEIVVMTTEVLRNMIYANSRNLQNLAFVVLDEVHYLGDKFRGAVWEENPHPSSTGDRSGFPLGNGFKC